MLNTRIFEILTQMNLNIRKKSVLFQKIFTISLICLFSGFSIGNLFGTFLNDLRNFQIWDGFIICFILLIVEIINFLNYSTSKIHVIYVVDYVKKVSQCLNYFKIGLLFGFFVDAFKVGS
uniref:hypothetical chloroplast RF20 n=1 Tax=Symbiochloris sp. SG-2018 TaxID=2126034 RepID=UPI002114983D|nr:hypothetical chloroplast RF20 [Symbiochloris sp. SG-2018]UTQ75673.1 hypothetical chloroplast RF20 [Symbiochloris sp. SG-2018]